MRWASRLIAKRNMRETIRNLKTALQRTYQEAIVEIKHGRDLRRFCLGKKMLRLNVGCGPVVRDGWINLDFKPRAGVLYFNALNPLPIAEGGVIRIHAEHFLEHLEFDDAIRFLRECYRILSDRGMLRIIVPDMEKYVRAYVQDDVNFFEKLAHLGGASRALPTKGAICNQMFHMGGDHKYSWDFETLVYAAREAGFTKIARSKHNDEALEECIDEQDWWRPIESLYANITK